MARASGKGRADAQPRPRTETFDPREPLDDDDFRTADDVDGDPFDEPSLDEDPAEAAPAPPRRLAPSSVPPSRPNRPASVAKDDPLPSVSPGGVPLPAPAKRARPLSLTPPAKRREVVTEDALRAQVERMVEAYRLGDRDRFVVERDELESMRGRAGVANVVLASAALIRQSQAALSARTYDRALGLASAAIRLSPDLVAARWMQIRVLWAHDWTKLRQIGAASWGLVVAQLGAFKNQVALMTSWSIIVGLAVLMTVFAFSLIQLAKYIRYPAYDVAIRLPAFIGGGEMVIVLLMLVLLPTAFGFGPAVSALIAFVVVSGYQQASERIVSRLMMVVLAALPVGLVAIAPLITFHGSLVDDMATAISEAFAADAERRLLDVAAGKRNRDPTSALILARRKRLRGDLSGADLAYQRALIIKPEDPVGLNNRGVVQFMLGHQAAAASLFGKAAARGRAESILNLAIIRAEQGRFEEATTMLERARAIDDQLAEEYAKRAESGDTEQQLFEADVETAALWSRMFDVDSGELWGVANGLWSRVGGRTPLWSITVLSVIAMGFAFVLARRQKGLSTACPKCGTPANRTAYGTLCEQCTSVFLTAVAVEPRLRAKKENEVRTYQRRRRLTERLTSLVAGVAQLGWGRPAVGVVFFFFLSVAMLVWFFEGGVMVHDWRVAHDTTAGTVIGGAALVCAGILCLLSLRQVEEER